MLHSAMLDGLYPPKTPPGHWIVAPQMIRALRSIDDDIYVILPVGANPLFRPTSIDPGVTISTDRAKKALIRKYGYAEVSGGKGSHIKLAKAGAKPIVLTGHQAALSPGLLKHVLAQLGDYPLSRAREIL
jgi:predicted RNA binding protein YcfA (HicA-like mRNA interferase family)